MCSPLDCQKAAKDLGLLEENGTVLVIQTTDKLGDQDSGVEMANGPYGPYIALYVPLLSHNVCQTVQACPVMVPFIEQLHP